MQIIVNGASGKMGKEIVFSALSGYKGARLAAAADRDIPALPCPSYSSVSEINEAADVIIDFSHHSATCELLGFAAGRKMPAVIATTGQTAEEIDMIKSASMKIPVFFCGNMSLGTALLLSLVKTAIKTLPDSEVEIIETHHSTKFDVPSGTALMLASAVKEARGDAPVTIGRHENGCRTEKEIGIHSVRLGKNPGCHEVIISTGTQTLSLKHEVHSRAVYAEGAIAAASFLLGKPPGLYSLKDLLITQA